MLIANYSIINQLCGHNHSGITNPLKWIRPHVMRGYYTYTDVGPNDAQIQRDGFPTGTNPPYSLVLGDKGALLSSTTTLHGATTVTSNVAMGRAIESTLTGTGALTDAPLSLIIQLACSALNGSGVLSVSMSGIVQLASSLAGTGDLTASLKLLASVICTMTGSGAITSTLRGTATLEADITPFTTLSPENLAASVWNAVAASYNSAGTMGEKLNDAGSAANPWTEVIESGYTAAEILRILAAVAAGKTTITGSNVKFRDINDTVDRVDATVSGGQRTNVTLDTD